MAQVFYTFSSIAQCWNAFEISSFVSAKLASGCIRFILVFHHLAGIVKEVRLGTRAKKTIYQTETNSIMVSRTKWLKPNTTSTLHLLHSKQQKKKSETTDKQGNV